MKLILLVDDSNFQRIAIGRMLTKAGYDVLTVGDGEEALRLAFVESFDLIVSDVRMPRLDGLGLTARLRADTRDRKSVV